MEIVFKRIWLILVLISFFSISSVTFILFKFGHIGSVEKVPFTIWNFVIPNMLSLVILFIYSKELFWGYQAKSKEQNIKSLLGFTTLIVLLTIIQIPQIEPLVTNIKWESWILIVSLIVVLTSYIGIIINRIVKLKELKAINSKKTF